MSWQYVLNIHTFWKQLHANKATRGKQILRTNTSDSIRSQVCVRNSSIGKSHYCEYWRWMFIFKKHFHMGFVDNDHDNDNEIIFIAKWHTNHVQKVMTKTKPVIGLLYMKHIEPGKGDVKPSWLMCPNINYTKDIVFWSAEQKQCRVLELF